MTQTLSPISLSSRKREQHRRKTEKYDVIKQKLVRVSCYAKTLKTHKSYTRHNQIKWLCR